MKLIVAKNRFGPTGSVAKFFHSIKIRASCLSEEAIEHGTVYDGGTRPHQRATEQ